MNWTFKIQESSNGVYTCEGKRSTGNSVSLTCDESEIYRIYKEAYELERGLGTSAGRAAFLIVKAAKPTWVAEYSETAFGSWLVSYSNKSSRIVFDGKDFILMAYIGAERPQWQGRIGQIEPPSQSFFELLSRA